MADATVTIELSPDDRAVIDGLSARIEALIEVLSTPVTIEVPNEATAAPSSAADQAAPPAAEPAPAPATAEQPSAPAPAAEPDALYTFDGDPSTVDANVWAKADVQTVDSPPRPLFRYAGSNPAVDVGAQWHLYTGQTQPVAPVEQPAAPAAPAAEAPAPAAEPAAPEQPSAEQPAAPAEPPAPSA